LAAIYDKHDELLADYLAVRRSNLPSISISTPRPGHPRGRDAEAVPPLTKGTAFHLDLLEADNDRYGHLPESAVTALVGETFDIVTKRTLGSPLMLASIAQSPLQPRCSRCTSGHSVCGGRVIVGWKPPVGRPRTPPIAARADAHLDA